MTKTRTALGGGSFDRAAFERSFMSADYPESRRLLEALPKSDEATLLSAQIAFRERRYVDMIEPLASMKPRTDEAAIERDILLGAAYGHTKDYSTARLRLDRALEKTAQGSRLQRDALFYKGLIAWIEHEHRECEALAMAMLPGASPNDRARAHTLLSWVAVRRRDASRQIEELQLVLDALEEADLPDEFYRAKALMALSSVGRELPMSDATNRARALTEKITWTPGIALQHFQTLRMLGWVDALQGDELSAFRNFRLATTLAPSKHWRVLCLTDRAYLARNTGEPSYAEDLLYEAHELAGSLSWHETNDESRSALFVIAALYADTNPALAQQYLAQYRSLSTSVLPGIAYDNDARIRAFASYSSGIALLGLDEPEEAVPMLAEAWEIFNAFGYGWRAALCSLALYRATDDAKFLAAARREIGPWPKSWIAREIAEAGDSGADSRLLSKAQRRVLDLLLEGKSNADIAKALGRSPYTVRNHIAQLFRTYNVTNRTQLAGLFRISKRTLQEH